MVEVVRYAVGLNFLLKSFMHLLIEKLITPPPPFEETTASVSVLQYIPSNEEIKIDVLWTGPFRF